MNSIPLFDLARNKPGHKTGMQNAGWRYDNYPELRQLDAGTTIDLASLEGPGVVTCFHITQHLLQIEDTISFHEDETREIDDSTRRQRRERMVKNQRITSRGLIIEIFYDGFPVPAVRCPLSDFFSDGCTGSAIHFSTPFLEKLPESYNCYIPMPFKKSIRITLKNETPYNYMSYSFVEYEQLPEWRDDLLYFHASWRQDDFQLTPDTEREMISLNGEGHLIGNQFSVITNEPVFKDFFFVMEGNCEHRIDGEENPSIDYLGTEDSFCLSWGFREEFCGLHSGINYLQNTALPYQLSLYRFRYHNPIRFKNGLDIRINWKHEFTLGRQNYHSPPRERVRNAANDGGCNIQYSSMYYWYQSEIGFDHPSMPDYEIRTASKIESGT